MSLSALAARPLAVVLLLVFSTPLFAEEAADKTPPVTEVTGRVVLADNPAQGVPSAEVFGHSEDLRKDLAIFWATCDADGKFSGKLHQRTPSEKPLIIRAFNKDRTLGTVQRFEAVKELALELAPTAAIHATVLDDETGDFARIRAVRLHLITKDGGSTVKPLETVTDASGYFRLVGLVPGQKYRLHIATEFKDGKANFPQVSVVVPESAEEINLDVLHIPEVWRPPTFEEFVASRYLDKPAEDRLTHGLNMARLGNVRVLVIAMERDEDAAKQFYQFLYDYFYHRESEELKLKIYQFIPLSLAPAEAQEFLKQHGITIPAKDDGTFAVLDSEGAVVSQKSLADLKSGGALDPMQFAEFLEANLHPPLASAKEELDSALAEALRDSKRVLIQTGGPGCGPCYLLAEYLESHESLVTKDYVVVKLDNRMPDFKEVYEKLSNGTPRTIPWMTILDGDGETLITGDTEEGNIGFPVEGAGLKQFERMLMTTRQNLTDDEISSLIASLQKRGEEIQKSRKE